MLDSPVSGGVVARETAAVAMDVAVRVAERLADPRRVRDVACAPGNEGLFGDAPWSAASVSHGFAGTVLLFGELDRALPGSGWDAVARDHVVELLRAVEADGLTTAGVSAGAAGVSMALWSVSRGGTRYGRAAVKLDGLVVERTHRLVDEAQRLEDGTAMQAFDAIGGLAGIAGYLLRRPDVPGAPGATARALAHLAGLAQPLDLGGGTVRPGWWVPAERQFTADDVASYPHGCANVGLAHGIAGPVATLALASLSGLGVDGQDDALRAMASWLAARHRDVGDGPLWPPRLGPDELDEIPSELLHRRASWCYGAPGIARALHLAGRALDDRRLAALAVDAATAVFSRDRATWDLEAATICHGTGGLLQFALRMAADTGDARLAQHADALAQEVAAAYDDGAPFGYRDVERQGERAVVVDKAGMLEGAAGVALALCSAGSPRAPLWDRALLLA
jgi:hypothetical protein